MGVKNESVDIDSVKYNFRRIAGRSIIEHKPIFSPDKKSILIIVENKVRVYNIQTGEWLTTLEADSHVDDLLSIEYLQDENHFLFGCSVTGHVSKWTIKSGAILREIVLTIPDKHKVVTFNLLNNGECLVSCSGAANNQLHISKYSLVNGAKLLHFKTLTVNYNRSMVKATIGCCNKEKYVAFINGTSYLFIQNLNSIHVSETIVNLNQIRLTAVEAHSTESCVAVADALGRVILIKGNLFDKKHIAREVLSWHQLPPYALSFSLLGNYLYSGGMEKVLVKWTLGSLAETASEKQFIPRMPGMIRYISTNNKHVAVALSNNSVVIANSQMQVVSTISDCGGVSSVTKATGSSLLYDSKMRALLLGGRPGHLQLFSTNSEKVLYSIDITEVNALPSEKENLIPLELEVTSAAISPDGSWLATSEYRNDEILFPEERLKFWHIQQNLPTPHTLNTCVNLSHGGFKVLSLAMSNKGDHCVSAGSDQKFRIWKRENHEDTKYNDSNIKYSWTCLTACYYSSGISKFMSHSLLNNFKNHDVTLNNNSHNEYPYMKFVKTKNDILKQVWSIHKERIVNNKKQKSVTSDDNCVMGDVAISEDGSLIAVWFGSKLTLWDTYLNNLHTTLSHPALKPKGKHVKFGNGDAAHYLVCTTHNCMAVWSLLSLTIKWLVNIYPTCLASEPFTNRMAVITNNNDVIIFTPHSSKPLMQRNNLVSRSTGVFDKCTFATDKQKKDEVRLYVMRNGSEIYSLEPIKTDTGLLQVVPYKLPHTKFSALQAEQQMSAVKPLEMSSTKPTNDEALRNSALAQFLSAAPHMIPPISLLCTPFLQHISGEQLTEAVDDVEENPTIDLDSSSSDEEEIVPQYEGPYAPQKTKDLWSQNFDEVNEKRLKKIVKKSFVTVDNLNAIF